MADNEHMQLPTFRYYPDPLATGSIVPSDNICTVCRKARGYIYPGPPYGKEEYMDEICPWCIADGSAHRLLHVEFADGAFIGTSLGSWPGTEIPDSIKDEIAFQTPSFNGWQTELWLGHCGDAAAFLAPVGYQELEALGSEAIEAIRSSTGLEGDAWWDFYLRLNKDGSPTGYIFRCLHCRAYGGYTDCD